MTCLGNRRKAVLLLYRGRENCENERNIQAWYRQTVAQPENLGRP